LTKCGTKKEEKQKGNSRKDPGLKPTLMNFQAKQKKTEKLHPQQKKKRGKRNRIGRKWGETWVHLERSKGNPENHSKREAQEGAEKRGRPTGTEKKRGGQQIKNRRQFKGGKRSSKGVTQSKMRDRQDGDCTTGKNLPSENKKGRG